MKDINDDNFQVGDTLKVIKWADCGEDVQVGDVVECIEDDGTRICRYKKLSANQTFYYYNDRLQKL